ncbi:MAG: DNA topoisomerase IV subunit A [Desulfobulbaceae bacterium]|nr:DNA topoisomerase IV subunit A [Desulfobulbaceae bacterium]
MTETFSEENTTYGKLHQLFDTNFLDYTSYVIRERAIPDIKDGLKPVQRRILQTLFNMDDGRFHKVANVVGDTMKLHPHGDASIFAALVNLANKEYLIERQGNFGNIFTGDQASASRYIECRLSPLAKKTLFNKELTTYTDSYDGRMQEPVTLPAKIPLILMLGAEGIAVGMATKIMPHNFEELLKAQISYLREEDFVLYPDFPRGGIVDVSEYDHGNGKLLCRARIKEVDDKTITITELPYNITTQTLIESVERAAKAGKVKITSINDYTAEQVEVEIKLAKEVYAEETIMALYAFTDCEISVSPNLTLIRDNTPVTMSVEEVLKSITDELVRNLEKELGIEIGKLLEKLHARRLEQIFIEERLYKRIEEISSQREIVKTVKDSLEPFRSELDRNITREDIDRLLEIKIRRISRFDINRQQKEIKDIEKEILIIRNHLKDMIGYTIMYIESLIAEFGAEYPRRSEIRTFDEVAAREAAFADLTVCYHKQSGFLGHKVEAENQEEDREVLCSEYDRILIIYNDGRYKVVNVPEKLFIGGDVHYVGVVEKDTVFNVIYKNGQDGYLYIKRFSTPKYILNREYRLIPEHANSQIRLLTTGKETSLRLNLVPKARAKYNRMDIVVDEYLVKGAGAKGKRLTNRTVRKITNTTGMEEPEDDSVIRNLPGFPVKE